MWMYNRTERVLWKNNETYKRFFCFFFFFYRITCAHLCWEKVIVRLGIKRKSKKRNTTTE